MRQGRRAVFFNRLLTDREIPALWHNDSVPRGRFDSVDDYHGSDKTKKVVLKDNAVTTCKLETTCRISDNKQDQ